MKKMRSENWSRGMWLKRHHLCSETDSGLFCFCMFFCKFSGLLARGRRLRRIGSSFKGPIGNI